ncbi:hypothetical protein Pcinc_004537 [Petrolisthes cinctipes]|uniref:Uncharacterized protein n=1 Tax=Petrolisthes cinctipes TaxID=88211 RepID=A0AAE1L013_PETCI|nr:hypothetical protein Pcinc_004537 [Petrolisthes cinctipes]
MVHRVAERSQEGCFSRFRGVQDVLNDKGEGGPGLPGLGQEPDSAGFPSVHSRLSLCQQGLTLCSTTLPLTLYPTHTPTIPTLVPPLHLFVVTWEKPYYICSVLSLEKPLCTTAEGSIPAGVLDYNPASLDSVRPGL